jgi:hypothetical protein
MPRSGGTPHAEGTPLADYVTAYLIRTGESVRALAKRSRDPVSGIAVSHNWIQEIVNREREIPPDLRRLRGLAAGMGTDVDILARMAAQQWLGVEVEDVTTESGDTMTVTVPPGLSKDQRSRLRQVVERMAQDLF